ncbi:MAG: M50 family metallopeptidase [bacterium]|nr:M50 family metallopeptidase [bacterium]
MIGKTLVLLTVFFVLSFVLGEFWQRIFSGKKYRIFLAPGVIVHELSHALACLIAGAKIRKISFFASNGGYVIHEKPKLPVLGEIIISLAPILGGLAAIFLMSSLLRFSLPISVAGFMNWVIQSWLDWRFWLFVYLDISVIICLIPSSQDLKNAFPAFLLLLILLWILKDSAFLKMLVQYHFEDALLTGIALEIFCLIISLPLYSAKLLFRR